MESMRRLKSKHRSQSRPIKSPTHMGYREMMVSFISEHRKTMSFILRNLA